MTEPTEAEVEAFAKEFKMFRPSQETMSRIRRALTAAAQVRERADMEALQRAAAHDQPMICRWCNQMHHGGPENCNNPDATYTKAQSTQPDVLGMRKGEE